jgi:hypothetical protein
MFEICESNPFDVLNKKADHHEGKHISIINIIHSFFFCIFLVLTLDSDDDFEVV